MKPPRELLPHSPPGPARRTSDREVLIEIVVTPPPPENAGTSLPTSPTHPGTSHTSPPSPAEEPTDEVADQSGPPRVSTGTQGPEDEQGDTQALLISAKENVTGKMKNNNTMYVNSGADAAAGDGGVGGPNDKGDLYIVRPALTLPEVQDNFSYTHKEKKSVSEKLKKQIKSTFECDIGSVWSLVTQRLPILSWLPKYDVRTSLLGDVIAGCTVAIMHIPQGMAYALLANLPPICGIYMAFFPVFLYAFLGTSRHCSMGTFAVVCLMTGKVVGQLATDPAAAAASMAAADAENGTAVDGIAANQTGYTPEQVASAVALMVGLWELALGMLQLGVLSVFLSDMLVSGFTTGAAVHVLTSQVKYIFGINISRHHGPLKIIFTYIDIIKQLLRANPATMIVSGITIAALVVNNEVLKPRLRKKTKIPIPIELICVVLGTAASFGMDLSGMYDIRVVGHIPTGLPEPSMPPTSILSSVILDAFIITIVAYTVSFSMAKIFAKRHDYTVDATQELYSQGLSNLFGSIFSCAPVAASLSRSLIQEAVGGVTQVTSFISCSLLLLVLLFIGPVFELLPNCVLSSIILVALKGMFLQFNDFFAVWKLSKADGAIWIASFLGVVIIDIDYGLLIGVLTSLVVLLVRNQKPATARLGHIPNTDVYLDMDKYSAAEDVPGIKVFQFLGNLHFANREYFRSQLITQTRIDPRAISTYRKKEETKRKAREEQEREEEEKRKEALKKQQDEEKGDGTKFSSPEVVMKSGKNGLLMAMKNKTSSYSLSLKGSKASSQVSLLIPDTKYVLLDLSCMGFLDTTGAKLLVQIFNEFKEIDIIICGAGASETVLKMLDTCNVFATIPKETFFHSVHDAITVLSRKATETVEPITKF
ncbi:solute carrier family 26 member prestin isoform X2 [Oratosquilla oratoria]|uniref:solute carrier family 26 member prestin isoform X2 n=1 Tax=Oratosquilla oratoria TaxID=337810 RepID=UPI003F75CD6F